MVNPVNIESLYNLEKSIFGIETAQGILTPNEYAKANSTTFLDVLAPSFYLCWVPIPMLFVIYLFFTDKNIMARFTAAFLLINIVGLIIVNQYSRVNYLLPLPCCPTLVCGRTWLQIY